MRRNLKKALSVVLAMLFAFGSVPAFADEVVSEFFPPITIHDITYYDMLGSRESKFESGLTDFYRDYMATVILKPDGEDSSVLEKWGDVAEAFINAAVSENWKDIKKYWAFNNETEYEEVFMLNPYGTANNLREAYLSASRHARNGGAAVGETYEPVLGPEVSEKSDFCVYYVKKGERPFISGDSHNPFQITDYEAYAVIAHNFSFGFVVNGKYIQEDIETLPGFTVNLIESDGTFAQRFSNETTETAQATAQLTTTYKETMSLTQTHSEAHSYGQSVYAEVSSNVGPPGIHHGAENTIWNIVSSGSQGAQGFLNLKIGGSLSWQQVYTDGFNSTHAVEGGDSSSSTLSVSLPPYTEAYIIATEGKGEMAFDFDLPMVVAYDIDIIYFSKYENKWSYAL